MVIVEKRKTKPEKKDVDLNKQAVFRARPAIMDKIGQNVQILKLGAKTFTRNREQLPHTAVHFVLNDYWIYRKVTMRLPLVKVVNLNKQVVFRALEQNFKAWGENFPTESGAAATPSCPLPSFPPLMPTSKSTESAGWSCVANYCSYYLCLPMAAIPDICQFWYTAALFMPVNIARIANAVQVNIWL